MKKPSPFTLVRSAVPVQSPASGTPDHAPHKSGDPGSGSNAALRVGILDMGTYIGRLPELLTHLNAAQDMFIIFDIVAPVPGGMVRRPADFVEWLDAHSKDANSVLAALSDLTPQIIADEIFVAAESIRRALKLDLVIGMTPAMVAGTSREGVYWNHFSCVSDRTIVVSAADLRVFAKRAGRPFEAAVGALITTTLLVATNDRLGYHEDTGCLFDYNESRTSLVDTLKRLHIDQDCLDKMPPGQRKAGRAMLMALKKMKMGDTDE